MKSDAMPVVLISGGTGLVGSRLARHLLERGYEVIILTRDRKKNSGDNRLVYSCWDVEKKIIDGQLVRKADYIIHLAGASVIEKKWIAAYRKKIADSRIESAALLLSCLREGSHHVKAFISASGIGWYGNDSASQPKKAFTETDPPADHFLGDTCVRWEAAADAAADLGLRVVKLRTGIVLSNDGGAYKEFTKPLRYGFATILGSGKQVMSWIHIDDLCRMYAEAVENNSLQGSYNAVAPEPVTQKNMELLIARTLKNRFFSVIYVPAFIIRLLYGKRSIEILKSTTVSCKKIKSAGFTFLYPSIEAAVARLAKPGQEML